jgi:hypothetical protein
MGATTIRERWDSMLPDGSINPDGARAGEPRWRLEDGVLTLDAVLPDGVTGIVSLPGEPDVEVTGAARVVG